MIRAARSARRPSTRYLTKGTYTAKLTVSDPAGNTDTATIAITVGDPVGNESPTVEAAAVPQSGTAPLDVQFSATGTDPDGDALTYRWSFGDGSAEAAGRRARHVYTRNGVFTATVTATDRAGQHRDGHDRDHGRQPGRQPGADGGRGGRSGVGQPLR